MSGALLSEVWPDMIVKKPRRKKKNIQQSSSHYDKPFTLNEMETELLDDNENIESNTKKKLAGMRVSPYTDNEMHYQSTERRVDLELNDNIVRPDLRREYKKSYEEDEEYQEFLEFKKRKLLELNSKQDNSKQSDSKDEQFNELLLYIFTGFFLLMIYDNIYKLGKNSY